MGQISSYCYHSHLSDFHFALLGLHTIGKGKKTSKSKTFIYKVGSDDAIFFILSGQIITRWVGQTSLSVLFFNNFWSIKLYILGTT